MAYVHGPLHRTCPWPQALRRHRGDMSSRSPPGGTGPAPPYASGHVHSRANTAVLHYGGHVHSPRRRGMSIPTPGSGHKGACPSAWSGSGHVQRTHTASTAHAAPWPCGPCSTPRRAIKLLCAPLAGSSAPTRHVAAVRRRNSASVVGALVQSDQPAVGGPLRGRAVHRGPAAPDRPVVQPGLRLGPPGGPRDLPRVAGATLRHLLRPARAAASPRCIRAARMAPARAPEVPHRMEAFQAAVAEAERFLQVEMYFV